MNSQVAPARDPNSKDPDKDSIRRELAGLLPELRGFARFMVRDRTRADDLVQDTVLRALGALHHFQEGTSLRAWSFTILRRIHYEQVRRRRTEQRILDEQGTPGEGLAPPQDGQAQLTELQRRLWQLSPLLREALVLVGAQGLAYEEAAVICNVPVGTMKARVSRARTTLARELGHDMPAGGAA